MHTNIDLDESLVVEAMRLTKMKTKKEVIHLGLRDGSRKLFERAIDGVYLTPELLQNCLLSGK